MTKNSINFNNKQQIAQQPYLCLSKQKINKESTTINTSPFDMLNNKNNLCEIALNTDI